MKVTSVKKFGVAALAVFATLSLHAASTASVVLATETPVPEPSTYVAGALMLIPLGAGIARAYYKNRKK